MTDTDRSLDGWANIIERSRAQANGVSADGHADADEATIMNDDIAVNGAWIGVKENGGVVAIHVETYDELRELRLIVNGEPVPLPVDVT
jgi:hypothetical protein